MLFAGRDVLQVIRRLRANSVLTYAIAIGCVTVATMVRFAIEGEVPNTVPFTTYSLALIIASALGGFWPGMVALILAALGGGYLFLPPSYSFALEPKEIWALVLFVSVGAINVGVLSALMASVLARDEHQQFLKRELQHRSQNVFAVVQAIASRSLVCGKRLKALPPVLIAAMERHGRLELDPLVRTEVVAMSAATIDRALAPCREAGGSGWVAPALALCGGAEQQYSGNLH